MCGVVVGASSRDGGLAGGKRGNGSEWVFGGGTEFTTADPKAG